jgi:hypothetical protein
MARVQPFRVGHEPDRRLEVCKACSHANAAEVLARIACAEEMHYGRQGDIDPCVQLVVSSVSSYFVLCMCGMQHPFEGGKHGHVQGLQQVSHFSWDK